MSPWLVDLEPHRLSKLGLTLVEGPKLRGLELQGTGDVQCVQGSNAESRYVLSCQVQTLLKEHFGQIDLCPHLILSVFLEAAEHFLCFIS